jgi:catechol 2,3-dioxygenase-like lactoylglutathione lyase family enzyme
MKRIHIHVGVTRIDESIRFYSALFGAKPLKTRPDYAQWMLEDPRVNFAISTRASRNSVDHLGIQVEEDSELAEMRERVHTPDMSVYDEGETVCCYARSDKSWVKDPSGIAWESYRTMEDVEVYSNRNADATESCCAPDIRDEPRSSNVSDKAANCCD